MPKKTSTKETVASAPVRVAAKPRVKTVKHSKAAAAPVAGNDMENIEMETIEMKSIEMKTIEMKTITPSVQEQIAKIAYGYWEARGFQPGSPEQDWLRAEREFLGA
jgi:hypothetical protein